MVHTSAIYEGDKHCQLTHGPSNSQIYTDAPKDNNGKGELFSPTDLVGAALVSCTLTVMAIAAEKEGINIKGARGDIEKEMVTDPRRIGTLRLKFTMPAGIPKNRRGFLERVADTCPVRASLRADLQVPTQFIYPD